MIDVLVCHDLSDFADRGATALQSLVAVRHLHVVCVLPRIDPSYPGVVWPRDEDEARRAHAHQELERRFRGQSPVVHVVIGEPGARIVEVARQTGVDLVALPTRGHGGLQRLVEGSVADHVCRFAPCPVLVVPPAAPVQHDPPAPPAAPPEAVTEQVDALAVRVCDEVEARPGWLSSITVTLPPTASEDDWLPLIEARLADAGIDHVDILTSRQPGPVTLLHTRFEDGP